MIDKINEMLRKLTGHNIIELTSRGNTAIFAALYLARQATLVDKKIVKDIVLIPDQGGWLTYRKYPKMLALKPVEIKTGSGVIDTDNLKKAIKENKDILCLLYSNPAGYFAEQPYKEIFEILNKNKITTILDITGCIGDGIKYGDYADILVASFGEYKPVDAGYGGFVSIKDKDIHSKGKEIFNTDPFDMSYSEKLLGKLGQLKERYKYFDRINKKIKDDLKGYDIIHKDKKGINVVVRFRTEAEKERLINYCEKNNYPYKLCPMYIKVNEKAISIEVQRC